MRSRDLIDGFDYNEHMQRQMFCFGSSDDGGGGGGGLSDEDIDQDVQQDIAAASAGLSRDNYSYGDGFDPGGRDEQIAAQAVRNIVEASTIGTSAAQRSANAQAMQNELAKQASVNQAVEQLFGVPSVAPMYGPKGTYSLTGLTGPNQTTTGGITAEQVAAMNAAQKGLGISPYSAPENVGYDPVTGMPIGGGNLAGLTRDQYASMPGYMQNIYDKTGAYNFEVNPAGRVTGFYGPPGGSPFPMANLLGKGIVGLTNALLGPPMTEEDLALRSVYTGFGEGSKPDGGRDNEPRPPVKSVDPVTGQCDEGYIFDEDLQACRMDTSSGATFPVTTPPTFSPGAYARMGLLDQTPQGLLQVAGQPYDFDAANKAFRMATATRPEYYSDPYDLKGYTLLA